MKRSELHRILLAGAALFGLAANTAKADYAAQVLAKSPTVYYRLNENVTVPPADLAINKGSLGAAENGYYGVDSGHPLSGALVGSSDTAVGVNGGSSVVAIPYSAALNPTAFTVEAWLQPGAEFATGSGTLTCAISSGVFSSPRTGWLIYQSESGWNFRMYNSNGTATSASVTGGTAPVAGNWYHVVATYDGATAVKVYVNGVAASGTATGYVTSAGGPMFIGGRTDNSFFWNGAADEVAVYSGVLSDATIASHYNNGISATPSQAYDTLVLASSPLAYYRLDEPAYTAGTSPVAANAGTAGASYDGAYAPGVDANAAGPRPPKYSGFEAGNTSAGLNGYAGFVGTPYTLNDLPALTVMGWLKRGTVHSGRGGYFGQNDMLEIGDADNGANIEVWINAYGTNIKIPYPFPDNEWGLFVFVGDATHAAVYTNGFLAASITRAVDSFGNSGYNFNIGGGGIFNATGDYFKGAIDEVAVFDKALTPEEITAVYYGANVAPTISQQPVAPARSLVVGNTLRMSVSATGTAPLQYVWRKGGTPIPGQTSATLVINGITAGDAGSYDVVVSNGFGSATSTPVSITVGPAETVAPTVLYADSGKDFKSVRIWFSEPLDAATAQNISSYVIKDGATVLPITSATLASPAGTAGDNMVDLVTAAQTPGHTYTITINGVKDQTAPANTIAANSTVSFQAWVLAPGYLAFEHFDNLNGAADADITSALADPRVVADKPTTAGFVSGRFDTRTIFADDTHEHYLAKISGYIVPTVTDDYYFFLRSDDAGRLYLSTTEAIPNPNTDTPIATEPDCCDGFYEPDAGDPSTTATPIHLVGGQKYGVLALLKEEGGGDYLQVAWRSVSDQTPAASLPYMPGQFLATYVDPNVDLQITTQPTDQQGTVAAEGVTLIAQNFTTSDGGLTVDSPDNTRGPWLYDAGSGLWSAEGSDAGCGNPDYSKLTTPTYTMPVAGAATLSFNHRYSFEADRWDGGQVWISINGGAYTAVNPDSFTANGYPAGLIQGNNLVGNQRAFHDESAGYSTGAYITSSLIIGNLQKNDTISVQWVGAWDECSDNHHPSWVLKDYVITYGIAPVPSTFTAAATATRQGTATPFTYQWQRNDGSGFVDIAGETGSAYRFFPTAADMAATFRVVVSVPGKSVISNTVKLTSGDTTPPNISIATTAGTTKITFTGKLQSAATLNGTFTDVAGATSPYTVTTSSGSSMFYRSAK